MSKAKGLVTTVLDTMVRQFPVDSERYELVDLLTEWIQHSRYGMPLPAQMATEELAFIDFIEGTHETVLHIARAYEMTAYSDLLKFPLWKARADVAHEVWRLERSNPFIDDAPEPDEGFAHIVYCLWKYIIVRLQREVDYEIKD